MCGINGVIGEKKELIERMNRVTVHRGPDGSKIWESGDITLGQNRLSIIDLRSVADQPFVSADGRFVVLLNGEIYNYRELKTELSQFQFRSEGDTEVLLNAYRMWGKQCVGRLNGIFSFAIWDAQEKELFIARDPIGVKPLYYFHDKKSFVFSSEIKAVLEGGMERSLNRDAFSKYMCLLYTPGESTLISGIQRLLPGHTLTYKEGEIVLNQYYSIPISQNEVGVSKGELESRIRTTFDAVISRQLIADVPVGVYLSGGIDSTVITDVVSRVHSNIDTFSIGFDLEDNEESEKFNADYNLAEKTAKHYGTHHHGFKLDSKDVVTLLEEHVWHMDEPVGNLTALAQLKLAEYAKKHVSVVLGGDGGDELFGGYKRHGLAKKLLMYWRLPELLRTHAPARLQKANLDTWAARYLLFLGQKDDVLSRLCNGVDRKSTVDFFQSHFFEKTTPQTFLDDMMRADLSSWLVDESLLRSDKMAMAHGLEQRVPFLDTELVELARGIPSTYKVTLTETKKILKDAFKDRLPSYVLNQPKRGWISPGAKWLRRPEVSEYIKTVLSPSYYEETRHLFKWSNIEQMYGDHTSRKGYYLTPLWSVIVFQIWARRFSILLEE